VTSLPDLRELRVFVAVAEELNFTRAAKRLHLAQQAVWKTVAQLERELGVELLERTTHDVSLTPAGAKLLAAGRELLLAADAAFADIATLGRGLSGTVRVGMTPAVGPAVRSELVRALRDGAEDVSVAFVELRPRELVEVLRARAVDLVLARTAAGHPAVESVALRPTPAVVAVPADHRLAGREFVRLPELDGERLLTWNPPGTPYTDLLLNRLRAAGARVDPVEAAVTGGSDPPDLSSGAIAVLPEGWPDGEGVVQVPVEGELDLPLLLLWPAGTLPAAARRIRERMS